jgi:Gpi18-like mannosyltransferase
MVTPAPSLIRRSGWVLGVVVARLYLFGVFYLLFLSTDLRKDRKDFVFQAEGQTRKEREAEIQRSFWERLGPFDGQFYLDIANKGYRTISSSIHGNLGNYAFFPLLPAILASLRAVFPHAYIPLTTALTLLSAIIGTLVLWKLAEKCGTSALLAVGVLLCFPSAPFQYVLYTEGIFLSVSGLALLYAVEKRPWPALLFALLAGLSRPQGVLLAIPLFIDLVLPALKERQRGGRVTLLACLAVCAPLSGFVVMGIVSEHLSGSPFAFLTVQAKWGRTYEATGILKAIMSVFGYGGPPMDLLGVLVGLGCLPLMWKRLPLSLSLYGTAAVLLPLTTGSILSLARFISMSAPHMLALSMLLQNRAKSMRIIVLATLLVLQTLVARGLMGWYFVG